MKTNSLLLLVSLAVLTTSASAAQSQTQPNVIVLPTYVVSAPRYQAAEQQVNASLDKLRQQACAPACIATELPVLKDQVVQPEALAKAAQAIKAQHLAKL